MCKGGERHGESKVSCASTQHNVPGQGLNLGLSLWSRALNHEATVQVKLNTLSEVD